MEYKSFILQNYRGIKDRLCFDVNMKATSPHCIIGNNESGKTTILKGIELINLLCCGRKISNGLRNAIKPKGNYFTGKVTLGAVMSCTINELGNGIESLESYAGKNKIDLKMNFSYEFKRSSFIDDSDRVEIIAAGVHITEEEEKKAIHTAIRSYAPDVIYYDDFKFAVPETIRFLESGQSAHDTAFLDSDSNQHWQNIFTDILKGHAPQNAATFQEDVVDWLQNENNDPGVAHGRLRNMGQYLDKILQEWVKNKHNSIDGFQIIRKYGIEGDKVFQDYQICVLSGDNEFKMNERSKGLQWSFCFHILTSIRKNRHKAGFIFLLDEPASNLHIRPQNKMLRHLQNLCNGNCAVVYSTHAPELVGIKNKDFHNTFVAKNKADEFKETDIKLYKLKELNPENAEIQDIEPILAKLSFVDVNNLADADIKNDKQRWRSIIKAISSGFKLSKFADTSTILSFFKDILDGFL